MTRHIFRIEGMHCGSCSLLVDDVLDDLPGVLSTQTTKGSSTVELNVNLTSPDAVIAAVEGLGYRASKVS